MTIEPQVYCSHCYPCRHGKYNLCEELKVMGFQTTGTASEYFSVDASKVTLLPEEMSYEEGAMIEPLAVAVHAVKQMGDVKGMNIAVIGAGPIGNLVAQTAKGMGAARVMITDVSDFRLDKAKECGIDVCVNTKNERNLLWQKSVAIHPATNQAVKAAARNSPRASWQNQMFFLT